MRIKKKNDAAPTNLILIVDSRALVKTLENELVKHEYACTITASGYEAVHELETKNYAIVIYNLRLHDFDGLEFLRICRKKRLMTPVIMLCEESIDTRIVVKAMKLGASDILVSPFTVEELVFSIRENR